MQTLVLTLITVIFTRSVVGLSFCPVTLPQDTPDGSPCQILRQQDLARNQALYRLVSGEPLHPYATLNMTAQELTEIIKQDPFIRTYASGYVGMGQAAEGIFKQYIQENGAKPITSIKDYADISAYFRTAIQLVFGSQVRIPSSNEPFQSDNTKWFEDELYAQQTLAGVNPMTIQRVTIHGVPVVRRCRMKTVDGVWCHFPFEYDGQMYNSCIKRSKYGRPGCSTTAKYSRRRWRTCEEVDEKEKDEGSCTVKTTRGEWCHFPFKYKGQVYTSCTTRDYYRSWCSTTAEYKGRWGSCGENVGEENELGDVGLDFAKLSQNLNPSFEWEAAVQEALGKEITLKKAVQDGYIYALRYPMCDDLPTIRPDLTDFDPRRKMRDFRSPIVLLVSDPDSSAGGLIPLAIQTDHTPVSPVYTPKDGDKWIFAKLEAHITDLGYSQIVEHLVKVHFIMEAVCVPMKRNLPSQHPLHQIMKFHCREVTVPNILGTPALVNEERTMHQLFAYGSNGVVQLIRDSYNETTWDVTDFRRGLKKRGLLDKKRIPFFPYRDDGEVIFSAIENMVNDYINLYYAEDEDVESDKELQAFVNEISADGKGPNGGKGQIKGFPAKVDSKEQLKEIVSRMIWQLSGQHASVNYELIDYATYLPNMPTKIYNDSRVEPGTFSHLNLPNRLTAAIQQSFVTTLSTFRFDNLFDYGYELDDQKARTVVNRHFAYLMLHIQPQLEERNRMRKNKGQLTFPYLLPRWLPNGVQS